MCSTVNYCHQDNVSDPFSSVQLHGFSDASKSANGCVVYLRFETRSGKIKTVLVTSKSRVSPLKSQTMPRLELMGALILSRLLKQLVHVFDKVYTINNVFASIDSSIAYSWIVTLRKYFNLLYKTE